MKKFDTGLKCSSVTPDFNHSTGMRWMLLAWEWSSF